MRRGVHPVLVDVDPTDEGRMLGASAALVEKLHELPLVVPDAEVIAHGIEIEGEIRVDDGVVAQPHGVARVNRDPPGRRQFVERRQQRAGGLERLDDRLILCREHRDRESLKQPGESEHAFVAAGLLECVEQDFRAERGDEQRHGRGQQHRIVDGVEVLLVLHELRRQDANVAAGPNDVVGDLDEIAVVILVELEPVERPAGELRAVAEDAQPASGRARVL